MFDVFPGSGCRRGARPPVRLGDVPGPGRARGLGGPAG